jgi:hypothetical protein
MLNSGEVLRSKGTKSEKGKRRRNFRKGRFTQLPILHREFLAHSIIKTLTP